MSDSDKPKVDLFLDSGAFSAWTQKKTIKVEDYILFIKDNMDVITVYANLDVIGNAEATWKNQKIMEDAGLTPLPVFHRQDEMKYLYHCIDNYEYFCIGGMAKGFTTFDRTNFLDRCFKIICDNPGHLPKNKIHGFGMTSFPLIYRYPWYSIDSTSWVMTGRMGSIFVPRYRSGKWIYDENAWKIAVSNRSPTQTEAGKHITTLSVEEKKIFFQYIQDKGYKLGRSEYKTVEQTYKLVDNERWADNKPKDKHAKREVEILLEDGISNRYELRDEMNIVYFLDLEKQLPEWPWAFERKEGKNAFFQ